MSEMKYKELKKSIDSKNFGNLYFLTGEADLVSYFEEKILEENLGKNFTEFDFVSMKGEAFSNEKLSDSINTFPMMTAKKCIILKDIPWEILNNDDIKTLTEIISDIPEFSILVITQTSPAPAAKHAAKLTKIKNFVKKNGIFSNLTQSDFPMERQIIAWAKRDFGKNLTPTIAKKIMNLCKGYQIYEIRSEVKKICEFENAEEINENSLDIIWKANQKLSIFELPKAITSKNAKKAFDILESLLEQNEEPMAILGVISSEYNDVYRAKLFLENGENPAKLAEFFDYKNKEFRIKNAERTAKKLSFENIKKIISKLAKTDLELKTSSNEPKTALFETVAYILENLN